MTFALPAVTTFDRFAVTDVRETPSPSQTHFAEIEILGGDTPDTATVTLARATLTTHSAANQVTELEMVTDRAVRYVVVKVSGGLDIQNAESWLEIGEVIGNGTQQSVDLVDGFTGIWDARLPTGALSVGLIELKQDGVVVTGCFGNVDLVGTVTGNIARLTGTDPAGVPSAYILGLQGDQLTGYYSSNGGPFALMPTLPPPTGSTTGCSDAEPPEHALACGSIIYGINFDFNSANLRPESGAVLQTLYEGLQAESTASITIVGHTSTEGSDSYNQNLSERRAQSVVTDLIGRGIASTRIQALGRGEVEPLISPDNDEASRAVNRRVEIRCD